MEEFMEKVKENINWIILGTGLLATFLLLLGAYQFVVLGTTLPISGHQFFTGGKFAGKYGDDYLMPDYLKAATILLPAIAAALNYFKKDSKLATQISIGMFIASIVLIFIIFTRATYKDDIDSKKINDYALSFSRIGIFGIFSILLATIGVGYKLAKVELN